MNIPSIDKSFDLWEKDGSLRDVYFFGTTVEDWQKFLDFNKTRDFQYTFDSKEMEIPSALDLIKNREGSHMLSINVDEVSVNCHFFCEEEIELDIDPREIKGNKEHLAVLSYVAQLAKALHKTAYITPENTDNNPIFTFDPNRDDWIFHRSQ